jgi:hypothetical protein
MRDLGTGFVLRAYRERVLVDSEFLGCRFFERPAKAGERVTIIYVVEVALVFVRCACDVESVSVRALESAR